MSLQVGQKLWYVPNDKRWGKEQEIEVTKVGRKWANVGYLGRIDIETLSVDGRGYSSPGQCYLSREEWERNEVLSDAWWEFKELIKKTNKRPEGITIESIEQAKRLLGLDAASGGEGGII